MAVAISNAWIYGGAAALGVVGGLATGLLTKDSDEAAQAAHRSRLDGMSKEELRAAVADGGRIQAPWNAGVGIPVGVGLAIGGGGALAGGLYGLRNAVRYNAEPWSQRVNFSLMAFGAGALAAGVAVDLLMRD